MTEHWAAISVAACHERVNRVAADRDDSSTCVRCPPKPAVIQGTASCRDGRVEDGRGSLGHALRFPSPLIEPDVPISGIRLSDWLHREAHGEKKLWPQASSVQQRS